MSDIITIRKAEPNDADVIKEFNQAMALETENKKLDDDIISKGVLNLFKNPHFGFYLIAEVKNRVVGSLMVTTEWSDWRNGLFWWIQSVYVRKEMRRKGIYRKLYEHVKELASKEENICGFRLYVENENTVAQKTYKTLGMNECYYKMFEEIK